MDRSAAPVPRTRTALAGLLLAVALALPVAGPAGAAPAVPEPQPSSGYSTVSAPAAAAVPRYGETSGAVRSLQNRLIAAGLLKAELNTGYFGKLTRAALQRLQRHSGLTASGRVTDATSRALDRAVAKATGPRTWYHRETIGTSAEGRPVYAYRAGQQGRPVAVVLATMHGEENFGQYVARGLLEGRKVTGVDLWVVPVLNPDGLVRDRRWLQGGVDFNRNFPHQWIRRAGSGPRAASAKETRMAMRFLDRVNPRYVVSWHQPLIGVDSYRVKNRTLMKRLSTGLEIKTRRLNCHGSCHGTLTGWFNAHHDGAAITVEYGTTARSMARMKGRDANAVLKAVGGARR